VVLILKKILSILLCIHAILILFVPTADAAGVPEASAKSYILLEPATGTVLAERNAHIQMPVASLTKIMTAAVVLEHSGMDDPVEILPEHTGIEGSSMYLRAGETLTVGELLYGLMLASGNDAAVALAYHVAGGIPEFADLMNEKAAALGMENSNFSNPHGLDAEGHYSTAYDMAILAAWAMESEQFAQIVSTRNIRAAGRSLVNHNKLLWRYEGALGVKTGFTKKAGRGLVSCAQRDGTRFICVTISAPDDWDDHKALLNWGFSNYRTHKVIARGETVALIPLIAGRLEAVTLVAEENMTLLTKAADSIRVEIETPAFVYAPIQGGAPGGTLYVEVNGKRIQETRLLYGETIPQDEAMRLNLWEQIRRSFEMAFQ